MEKFWIVLGVVLCSAIAAVAESDAKSDPGQTYYVNSGIGRQFSAGRYGNFAAGDVNEYGYKHYYGVPKKSYAFRYKQPVQQFSINFPIADGQPNLLQQQIGPVPVPEVQPVVDPHQTVFAQHSYFRQGIPHAAPNSQFFIQSDFNQPAEAVSLPQPIASSTHAQNLIPLDPVTPLQTVTQPQPFQEQSVQFSQLEPADGFQQFVQLQPVTQLDQVNPPAPIETVTPLPFFNHGQSVSPLPLLHQVAQNAFAQPTHRPFVAFRQPTNTVPSFQFSFHGQQNSVAEQQLLIDTSAASAPFEAGQTQVQVDPKFQDDKDLSTTTSTFPEPEVIPTTLAESNPFPESVLESEPPVVPAADAPTLTLVHEENVEPLFVTPPSFLPHLGLPHLPTEEHPSHFADPTLSSGLNKRPTIRLQILEAVPGLMSEDDFGARLMPKPPPPGPELTVIQLEGNPDPDPVTQPPTTRFPPRLSPVRPLPAFPAVP